MKASDSDDDWGAEDSFDQTPADNKSSVTPVKKEESKEAESGKKDESTSKLPASLNKSTTKSQKLDESNWMDNSGDDKDDKDDKDEVNQLAPSPETKNTNLNSTFVNPLNQNTSFWKDALDTGKELEPDPIDTSCWSNAYIEKLEAK